MARHRSAVVAATVAAALVVGCGTSTSGTQSDGESGAGFPIAVRSAGETLTLDRPPRRIVSLSPTATEMLFAAGAGEQVAAVDDESDWPPHAPRTDLSAYQPNVEAIAAQRPDLVVVPDTLAPDAIAALRRLRLPVLVQPAAQRLADAYGQLRQLGALTGHRRAGARVARRVRARVRRLVEGLPPGRSLKVFHELDPDLYSAGSETFIGRIYARLGLVNVADPAAASSGSPYPQMSSEAVVAADPDLIVLADSECCGQTPGKVAARDGWDGVAAVRRGAVIAVDDDIASRWGPRIPRFVAAVRRAIEVARGSAGEGP